MSGNVENVRNEEATFYLLQDVPEHELLCLTFYKNLLSELHYIDSDKMDLGRRVPYPEREDCFLDFYYSYVVWDSGNKIYMAPRGYVNSNYIAVYDKEKKDFEYIAINIPDKLLDDDNNCKIMEWWVNTEWHYIASPKFHRIYQQDNYLFCIPNSYPAIVRVDLLTNEVSYYDSFINELMDMDKLCGKMNSYAFGTSVRVGSKAYLTYRFADLIVEFDMKSTESKVLLFSESNVGNHHIVRVKDSLWILAKDKPVMTIFNLVTGETAKCDYEAEIPKGLQWTQMEFWDGFIILRTGVPGQIWKIDVNDGKLSLADELIKWMSDVEYMSSMRVYKGSLYFTTNIGCLYHMSNIGATCNKRKLKVGDESRKIIYEKALSYIKKDTGAVMQEGLFHNLPLYLYQISKGNDMNEK